MKKTELQQIKIFTDQPESAVEKMGKAKDFLLSVNGLVAFVTEWFLANLIDENGNLKKITVWDLIFSKSKRDFVMEVIRRIIDAVNSLKKTAAAILLLLLPVFLFAQDSTAVIPDPPFQNAWESVLSYYNWLFGVLVLAWGQIAKRFGLKTKFPRFAFVVIAGAIVMGIGFVYYGTNFVQLAVTLLSTMGIFDLWKAATQKKKDDKDEDAPPPKKDGLIFS